MIRFEDEKELASVLGEMDIQKMWTLVKFAKHVRGRCRSNAALNNYLGRMFPAFRFEQVTKVREDGSSYPGLRITEIASKASTEGEDE